jgi:ATP-binding cassette subfamily E protein 1
MEQNTRIAIVNPDKCKPSKCKGECKKFCPVVKTGQDCIVVSPMSQIAIISENLCIGCNICVKKCPFDAIKIINIPSSLSTEITHRYGPNLFKLHRLPVPRKGNILGLVGNNGIGKSTAMQILAGKLKPNLGASNSSWNDILTYFRGSELQNYFIKIATNQIKSAIKPQYIDNIPKIINESVSVLLNNNEKIMQELELVHLRNRNIKDLSGGELQRFAIAKTIITDADIYMFDEPSSYLDIKQRLRVASVIKDNVDNDKYVLCIEHDLSVLDYLSDYVCVLYGEPGAFGVVTTPFSVKDGINIFLQGFIPTENLRIREEELTFRTFRNEEEKEKKEGNKYPAAVKVLESFELEICKGQYYNGEIIVMLGENGLGKTTFMRILAENPSVSYKPQILCPKFDGTVRELLYKRILTAFNHQQFKSDVLKPMKLESILDNQVKNLSGGELQRVAITICLGTPAEIYLIDEPSAYLDSEQRMIVSKIIRKFIISCGKSAFIVEHDFIMSTYLADKVIVFEGNPGIKGKANSPQNLLSGMNKFLKGLDITFRQDITTNRPRINKHGSIKDQEQKKNGTYFFIDDNE